MVVAAVGRPKVKRKSFVVTTLSEIAEFFGVTVPAVSKWKSNPGDPMPGRAGRFDLSKIVQWDRRQRDGSSLSDELKAADIRLKTAQAEAKELENEQARGKLVDIDEVDRWAASILIELRETLMQLPEILSTSSPPEIREFVRSESDRHIRDSLISAQRKLENQDYVVFEVEE